MKTAKFLINFTQLLFSQNGERGKTDISRKTRNDLKVHDEKEKSKSGNLNNGEKGKKKHTAKQKDGKESVKQTVGTETSADESKNTVKNKQKNSDASGAKKNSDQTQNVSNSRSTKKIPDLKQKVSDANSTKKISDQTKNEVQLCKSPSSDSSFQGSFMSYIDSPASNSLKIIKVKVHQTIPRFLTRQIKKQNQLLRYLCRLNQIRIPQLEVLHLNRFLLLTILRPHQVDLLNTFLLLLLKLDLGSSQGPVFLLKQLVQKRTQATN